MASPSVKTAGPRYVAELTAAVGLYTILVLSRPWLLAQGGGRAAQFLVKLSPIAALVLALLVVIRYYRRIDEYAQRQLLEVLALAFGLSAVAAASWSFLTDVGLPPLTTDWVWPMMAVCWGFTRGIQQFRNR